LRFTAFCPLVQVQQPAPLLIYSGMYLQRSEELPDACAFIQFADVGNSAPLVNVNNERKTRQEQNTQYYFAASILNHTSGGISYEPRPKIFWFFIRSGLFGRGRFVFRADGTVPSNFVFFRR